MSLGFVSDQRPKFTAKARSSPSLRTSKEAPGADQPILNGKKRGLSLGFCLCLFLSDLSAFAVSFDGLFENAGTVRGFLSLISVPSSPQRREVRQV